jgi:ABC-2 type transport system ATP-binding protein
VPSTTADTIVAVHQLTKRYGSTSVLCGIDLEVRRGEVFAILGPNGAGKTTTVEILTGQRRASGGHVRVLGYDPADDRREWRARIGVVPQSSGAFTDLTVREVVEHFAAFHPAPLGVGEVIDMVGLTAHANKQATTMSGGQQRRLDVAVGVIGDPELLFLDEPTTGLDPQARQEAWAMVEQFTARGTTTVLTTHYLDEAEALAGRAALIVGGRVVAAGPVAELGGRRTTVSFRANGDLSAQALPTLPAETSTAADPRHPDRVVLQTDEPTALLATLIAWATAAGVAELPGIRVHQPTLQDVYLQLIRDHDGPDASDIEQGLPPR